MDYLSTESGHWEPIEPKPPVVTFKVDMGPYVNAMKGVSSAFRALAERFATIDYSPAFAGFVRKHPMDRAQLAETLTHIFGPPMESGFGTMFVGGAPRITIHDPATNTVLRNRASFNTAFTIMLGTRSVVLLPRKGYTFTVALEARAWFVSHDDAPWGMLVVADNGELTVVRV